ncbi:hypothetical protein WMY93_011338 [Mugilogobius chulae]|uniref:Reactive oxygen species modulator 1 n=1 Tax=Mugilogobius chulae TaxID=88201 RepID=A0AAW0PB33_9GOBI
MRLFYHTGSHLDSPLSAAFHFRCHGALLKYVSTKVELERARENKNQYGPGDAADDHACLVSTRTEGKKRHKMPVAVGPYGQTQPSCFDRVKMGFMMGFAVGMAAGAMFGTFSCLRIGMRGRELMGGVGKTMMQSGGTFGTFMAIGMGIRC